MSRGPGVRQRALLEEVERDGCAWVTSPDMTASEASAMRRAAQKLEEAGKVVLLRRPTGEGKASALMAFRPEDVPAVYVVEDMRGYLHRSPNRRFGPSYTPEELRAEIKRRKESREDRKRRAAPDYVPTEEDLEKERKALDLMRRMAEAIAAS